MADNQSEAGAVEYGIGGATRVVVRRAGHLVYLEQPAEFTELVTSFAKGLPSPGTQDALRRVIEELRQGAPDYGRMGPALAVGVRANLQLIQNALIKSGSVRSLAFQRVGTDGADIYTVEFEHGSAEWRIVLGPNGRIDGIWSRPLP